MTGPRRVAMWPGQSVDLDHRGRVIGHRPAPASSSATARSVNPASQLASAACSSRQPRAARRSAASRPARSNAAAAVAYALRSRPRPRRPVPARPTPARPGPAAAAARCQARRSTSRSGSAAASARCASAALAGRRVGVDRRAGQRMAELHRAGCSVTRPALSASAERRQARSRAGPPARSSVGRSPVSLVAAEHQRLPARPLSGRPSAAGTRRRSWPRPAPARLREQAPGPAHPAPAPAARAGCRRSRRAAAGPRPGARPGTS